MTNCGKISKSLVLASCKSSTPAIEPEVLFMNFDDWDKATKKEVTNGVLSGLTLENGVFAYKYKSHKNAFETDCTLAKGTYVNSYDHKVICKVFVKTKDVKDEVNKMTGAKVVAIVKNTDKQDGSVKYELLGADNGLEMSEFSAPSSGSDGIIYSFTLASGDNAKESALPLTIDAGSDEATEALIKSLVKENA